MSFEQLIFFQNKILKSAILEIDNNLNIGNSTTKINIMLTTPPFDPAGLAQKLGELYALSDNDLLAQVKLITQDLNAWMASNFALTTDQMDYLNNMPALIQFSFAAQMGSVISCRGPIDMIPPDGPKRTKQTRGDCDGWILYNPSGAPEFQVHGTLSFPQP